MRGWERLVKPPSLQELGGGSLENQTARTLDPWTRCGERGPVLLVFLPTTYNGHPVMRKTSDESQQRDVLKIP